MSGVDPGLKGRKNKRRSSSIRNGKKKDLQVAKASMHSEANDEEAAVGQGGGKVKVPLPHQIKFYSGVTLDLLRVAVVHMDLFLLTKNGFPNSPEQYKRAKKCFKVACQMKYGTKYKCTCRYRLPSSYSSPPLLLAKMPEFTEGMSKLVSYSQLLEEWL